MLKNNLLNQIKSLDLLSLGQQWVLLIELATLCKKKNISQRRRGLSRPRIARSCRHATVAHLTQFQALVVGHNPVLYSDSNLKSNDREFESSLKCPMWNTQPLCVVGLCLVYFKFHFQKQQ